MLAKERYLYVYMYLYMLPIKYVNAFNVTSAPIAKIFSSLAEQPDANSQNIRRPDVFYSILYCPTCCKCFQYLCFEELILTGVYVMLQ